MKKSVMFHFITIGYKYDNTSDDLILNLENRYTLQFYNFISRTKFPTFSGIGIKFKLFPIYLLINN